MQNLDINKRYVHHFLELCKIPHGSGEEKQISDYLVEFAKAHNLEYVQDETLNVIIYKKGTQGLENAEGVALQAHIDMVNEKNPTSNHDFTKDPLEVYEENGFLKAKDTTLGADDGAGVSYILSILEDNNLKHPPLTCIFTVNEEATMIGAFELNADLIKAKRLINIDGEEEDASNSASAGGMDIIVTCNYKPIEHSHAGYKLTVKGLLGGHSGAEIHKEKGNSIKILARLLEKLKTKGNITLTEIVGGSKINAIPRDAYCTFNINLTFDEILKLVNETADEIKKELEYTDSNLEVVLEPAHLEYSLSVETSNSIINYLYLVPNGLRHYSEHLNMLTTASENIGVLETFDNCIVMQTSVRGALDSYVQDLANEIKVLANLVNFDVKFDNWYPAWDYMEVSPLRDAMKDLYHEIHGKELNIYPVHGGLECGIFKNKINDLDIVTMGPNIYDVHSPNEALDLASFDRTYTFLTTLLSRL